MLLKGQGVTIERPRRTLGTVVAVVPALLAAGLAIVLVVTAAGWPVSGTQFAAIVGAIVMFALAVLFAFWAYACYSMRYAVDSRGLTIVWGALRHFIPMQGIEGLAVGRGEDRPSIRGLVWPGLRVGRGAVAGREALFYSTHRSAEEIVYVRTSAATYAVSPQDPPRFIDEVERFRRAAPTAGRESVRRDVVGAHPIWADRVAQLLALAAIVANLALWAYIFAVYPDLSPRIAIEFPPIGDITEIHSRDRILWIPGAGAGVLAVNLLVGVAFQWRERAAAYLMLTGSVFLQLLFWVSAGIAVANA